MDKYKNTFINNVSKLDAVTDSCGELTKLASLIVDENSREATILLLKKLSDIIDDNSYKNEIKRIAQLVNTNLIEYYGYSALQSLCKTETLIDEDPRTITELLDDLNELVGLDNVKQKVNDLIAYQKIQKFCPKETCLGSIYLFICLEFPKYK